LAVNIRSNTGSLRKPNKYKPIDQKDKAKKFNALQPFNLYVDVTNLYRIQYRLQLSGNHWVEK